MKSFYRDPQNNQKMFDLIFLVALPSSSFPTLPLPHQYRLLRRPSILPMACCTLLLILRAPTYGAHYSNTPRTTSPPPPPRDPNPASHAQESTPHFIWYPKYSIVTLASEKRRRFNSNPGVWRNFTLHSHDNGANIVKEFSVGMGIMDHNRGWGGWRS